MISRPRKLIQLLMMTLIVVVLSGLVTGNVPLFLKTQFGWPFQTFSGGGLWEFRESSKKQWRFRLDEMSKREIRTALFFGADPNPVIPEKGTFHYEEESALEFLIGQWGGLGDESIDDKILILLNQGARVHNKPFYSYSLTATIERFSPFGLFQGEVSDAELIHVSETLIDRGAKVDKRIFNSRTPLSLAVKPKMGTRVSFAPVRTLLQSGANPNFRFLEKTPALHEACLSMTDLKERFNEPERKNYRVKYQKRYRAILNALIDHGARVNARWRNDWNSNLQTPLMACAKGGNKTLVRDLLEAGAMVGLENKSGSTAVMVAEANGHETTARIIRQHRETDDRLTPHELIRNGRLTDLEARLKNGLNPNQSDEHGWTVLMTAVNENSVKAVKILLDHGAKPGAGKERQYSALTEALANYNLEIVKLLVRNGAEFSREEYRRLLFTGLENKSLPWMKRAVRNGVDVGSLPPGEIWKGHLMPSTDCGCTDDGISDQGIVRYLLKNGLTPDVQEPIAGRTPLIYATRNRNKAMVNLLLEHEPRLGITDSLGNTALGYAKKHEYPEIRRMLETYKEQNQSVFSSWL